MSTEMHDNSKRDHRPKKKPRQYLIDRANGMSKLLDESRPPCFLCWVPKPVVWLSDYIESNRVFNTLGQYGWVSPDNLAARRYCIWIGLVCNIMAFLLQIYVAFAISTKYNLLKAASFTQGLLAPAFCTACNASQTHPYKHRLNLAIRAVAEVIYEESFAVNDPVVIPYEKFCNLPQVDILFPDGECDACYQTSKSITASLFISIIMYIPSITTDILRLYPHYDANCQKIFGGFAAIISVAFSLYTFMSYQFRCFRSIGFGSICIPLDCDGFWSGISSDAQFDEACQAIKPDETGNCPFGYYTVTRNFWAGPGWIALAIASGFKIIDMVMNIVIPTPSICWTLEEQQDYEDKYGKNPEGDSTSEVKLNDGKDAAVHSDGHETKIDTPSSSS